MHRLLVQIVIIGLCTGFFTSSLFGQCPENIEHFLLSQWDGKDKEASIAYSSTQQLLRCPGNQSQLRLVADIYRAYLIRDRSIDSAYVLLTDHQKNVDQILKEPESLGIYYLTLAQLEKKKGNLNNSNNALEKALAHFQFGEKAWGIAQVFDDLGTNALINGNIPEALDLNLQSIDIRKEANDQEGLARAYMNHGNIHRRMKNLDTAIQYYGRAIQLAIEVNNSSIEARATMNVAAIFQTRENLIDSAENLYKSVLPVLRSRWLDRAYGNVLNNLAIIKQNKAEYDSALYFFAQANEVYKSVNHQRGLMAVAAGRGQVSMEQGLDSIAVIFLAERLRIANELDQLGSIWRGHYDLYTAYSKIGKFDSALAHYESFDYYFDSVQGVRSQVALEEIQEKYDNSQLQAENDRLSSRQKIFILVALIILFITLLLLLFFRHRHRTRLKLTEERQQSAIASALLEGEESERERISKELHDNVGMLISSAKNQLESIEHLDQKVDALAASQQEEFQKANKLLNDAVVEVRRISHNMISAVLVKFGLVHAVKDLIESMQLKEGLKVELQDFGFDLGQRLDPKVELTLYRIIQEGLNNMMKHAKAAHGVIRLNRKKDKLVLSIIDDGKGFDPTAAELNGIGLSNIATRVSYLNGKYAIKSESEKGTQITVSIPL